MNALTKVVGLSYQFNYWFDHQPGKKRFGIFVGMALPIWATIAYGPTALQFLATVVMVGLGYMRYKWVKKIRP